MPKKAKIFSETLKNPPKIAKIRKKVQKSAKKVLTSVIKCAILDNS